MNNKKHKRRKGGQKGMGSLFFAGIVLLLGIIMLASPLPSSTQAGTERFTDTQKIQLAEDTALEIGTQEGSGTGDWKLILVNYRNPLPEGYVIQTVVLRNGFQVDERCYPDLQAMMDACRAEGLSPVICSAYRTWEYQETLYQQQVEKWQARGYPRERAETEAGKLVAIPGTSEHQLGLAVDIVDMSNQHLDNSQEDTAVQKWLMEHSWEYGFILRYPNAKSEITGIIYEPWHYRYVGKENAEQIYRLGVCLEEYLRRQGSSRGIVRK